MPHSARCFAVLGDFDSPVFKVLSARFANYLFWSGTYVGWTCSADGSQAQPSSGELARELSSIRVAYRNGFLRRFIHTNGKCRGGFRDPLRVWHLCLFQLVRRVTARTNRTLLISVKSSAAAPSAREERR
jgi:hypothetical protein